MFFSYVCALVLAFFVFQVIIAVLALPLSALQVVLRKKRPESRSDRWLSLLNQIFISLIFTGLVAFISTVSAHQPDVQHQWIYAVTGFVVVWFVLASNAQEKSRMNSEELWASEAHKGSATGAVVGSVVALLLYPIFYVWPQWLALIPGAVSLIELTFRFTNWISAFWVVRLIVAVTAAGYLFSAGLVSLVMFFTLWSMVSSVFRPKGKSPAKANRASAGSNGAK